MLFGTQSSEEMMKGQEAKGSDARLKHLDLFEGQREAGPALWLSGSRVQSELWNFHYGCRWWRWAGVGWWEVEADRISEGKNSRP